MDFLVYAIAYRLAVLAAGTLFMYFGYRLFTQGIIASEGAEVGGEHNGSKLWIRNVAPGTFFALFGTMLIGIMVWQGNPEMVLDPGDGSSARTILRGPAQTSEDSADFDLQKALGGRHDADKQIAVFADQLGNSAQTLADARDPLLGLASAYLNQGRADESIALVRLVYQYSGDDPQTLALMAHVEHARGDMKTAKQVAERLRAVHPDKAHLVSDLEMN